MHGINVFAGCYYFFLKRVILGVVSSSFLTPRRICMIQINTITLMYYLANIYSMPRVSHHKNLHKLSPHQFHPDIIIACATPRSDEFHTSDTISPVAGYYVDFVSICEQIK